MVKKIIIRLLFEFGGKILKSIGSAYREVLKSGRKPTDNTTTSKFNMSSLINTPMTKEEALKILNIKDKEYDSKIIMEKFDKFMEINEPMKGGSFYIQNKVYYAKEFLMQDFPNEENVSKHNPDYEESEKKEETTEEKTENKKGENEQQNQSNKEEEKINKAKLFMKASYKI